MGTSVIARCPGTCGEWIQGAKQGVPFLVDCPINSFSEVKIEVSSETNEWLVPPQLQKVSKLLELITVEQKMNLGGSISINSDLPIGKGMASSTADLAAVAAAIQMLTMKKPEPEQIARWVLKIEPSDSVMFPGITEMDHLRGTYYKMLGFSVPAQFLALDWGGTIDTIQFNSRLDLNIHYRFFEPEIKKALKLFEDGIKNSDLEMMALGGTFSADCNMSINPKPLFDDLKTWVLQHGGVGVITAHSGTLLSGVFPVEISIDKLIDDVVDRFKPSYIKVFKAIDGGVQID